LLLLFEKHMKNQLLFDIADEPNPATAALPHGKDEMNFAEFPIALLTDRAPKGQKFIKFEDEIYDEKRKKTIVRRRVIEGSEEYGLPTATDDLVILALIQLTKLKGDFAKREVSFTRLELIKLLGWADEGKSFDRIKLSLLRIKGVSYFYDNAWWDPRQKTWTTRAFNIIDNVEINDSRATNGQAGLFPSRIVWNEVVFDSFQAGFLRDIDFQLCMRLAHPTALRMYRFLGKRFYLRSEWQFDLKDFAHEHMGLGRNYEGGTQIARKLKPAIEELERVGFLEPLADSERFIKKGRQWSIRFVQKQVTLPPESIPQRLPTSPSPLVAALTQRGVTLSSAQQLVEHYTAELIQEKLEVLDWMVEQRDKRIAKNPAGYLVKSIENDYSPPANYISKAERERRAAIAQAAEQKAQSAAKAKQTQKIREKQEAAAIDAYWASLTPSQKEALQAAADATTDAEQLKQEQGPFKKMGQQIRRLEYIKLLLQAEGKLP
jgi:hypothetical protein